MFDEFINFINHKIKKLTLTVNVDIKNTDLTLTGVSEVSFLGEFSYE